MAEGGGVHVTDITEVGRNVGGNPMGLKGWFTRIRKTLGTALQIDVLSFVCQRFDTSATSATTSKQQW